MSSVLPTSTKDFQKQISKMSEMNENIEKILNDYGDHEVVSDNGLSSDSYGSSNELTSDEFDADNPPLLPDMIYQDHFVPI